MLAKLKLNFLCELCKYQFVTCTDIEFECCVIQRLLGEALNPRVFKIRGCAAAGLFYQQLIAQLRRFKRKAKAADFRLAANRKHFAANFPNMATTPLHHMGAMRQSVAKIVKGLGIHFGAR